MQGIVFSLPRLIPTIKIENLVAPPLPMLAYVDELNSSVRIKLQQPFPDGY